MKLICAIIIAVAILTIPTFAAAPQTIDYTMQLWPGDSTRVTVSNATSRETLTHEQLLEMPFHRYINPMNGVTVFRASGPVTITLTDPVHNLQLNWTVGGHGTEDLSEAENFAVEGTVQFLTPATYILRIATDNYGGIWADAGFYDGWFGFYVIIDGVAAPPPPPPPPQPEPPTTQRPSLPPITATPTPPAAGTRVLRFPIGSTTFTDAGFSRTLEAAPFIAHDRTMVPLRVIGEALGATNLALNENVVSLVLNGQTIAMTVGQPLPGGMGTPVIIADRTFVPLAYIINEMGAVARWDGVARVAYIYI